MLLNETDLQRVAGDLRGVIVDLCAARHAAVARIEQILTRCNPSVSPQFPNQWCDFAACVLGAHLCRVTKGEVFLVIAERPHEFSRHFWVVHNDINIDITCDQFPEAPKAPFVSRDQSWHDKACPDKSYMPFASRPLMAPYFERARLALELAVNADWRLTAHASLVCS